jgi:hypothetical protein
MPSTPIVATCSCELAYTPEQYRTLGYIGLQKVDDRPLDMQLELRNCICGSTLAVWVDKRGKVLDHV